MAFDVTHAHPAGVEADDLLVQARQPRLVLADELRLERAGPVPGVLILDLAELGLDRLRGRPVSEIASAARRRLSGRITQMVCQLALQGRLDHPARQLRQQPAGPGDLLSLKALQCVREVVPGNRPARRSTASCDGCSLTRADSGGFFVSMLMGVLSRPPRLGTPTSPTGFAVIPNRQQRPIGYPDHTQKTGQTPAAR